MNINRRRFVTIVAGMALAASARSVIASPIAWRGVVLGADAKLIITGTPEHEARRLIQLVRDEVERLENIFSIYRPRSTISTLNSLAVVNNPPIEFIALLSTVDAIHTASGDLFNPTIQPLWAAYAEHKGHPPRDLVASRLRLASWRQVAISTEAVTFLNEGMAMTLNGIAQGFITDRVVHLLKAEGLQNAVVKMGEISAIGRNSEGKAWDIGIADKGDGPAEDAVQLSDQSIATSSASGTTFDGKVSHIINPENGLPANSNWQRVSVIHKSAAIADGLSTAGILMSQSQLKNMLAQFSDAFAVAKDKDGRNRPGL